MSADRQRWRWGVACAAVLVGAFLVLALHEDWWTFVGVFHMRPYFADTAAILAAGDAHRAGLDVYQPNPFDPFGRPHVYGPWWLVTAQLGLVTADAWWVGALLGVLFVVAVLWLLAPRDAGGALATCLLILSPPVLLGIERGNNDLFIFLLLALATALLARRAPATGPLGAAVLVLAAVLKFYPLVALAALLARRTRATRLALTLGAALFAFAGLWWSQRADFFRALALAPRPDSIYAYGIRIFAVTWAHNAGAQLWLLGGWALGLAGAAAALWRGRAAIARAIPDEGVAAVAAVAGGMSWLFCYLANNNYSYRAVLWLLVVPAWLALARGGDVAAQRLGRGLCLVLLTALWMFLPKWWWLETLRGRPEEAVSIWRWVMVVVGIEQMLLAALTAVLALSLAAWAWRRWQAIAAT